MRLDRRLTLIGIMIVVLSMTMATQYATTKVTFSYGIVHPSTADIRFMGSDICGEDGTRVLRVTTNGTGTQYVSINLGDWMPDSKKNYTAAFAIVNEEQFYVNITHVNITGTNTSYLDVWLHGDRDANAETENGAVQVVREGAQLYSSTDTVWTLATGDGDPGTFCNDTIWTDGAMEGGTQQACIWDSTANVYYSTNDDNNSVNASSDFVWVQVGLEIANDAALVADATGTIYIHFKASTID